MPEERTDYETTPEESDEPPWEIEATPTDEGNGDLEQGIIEMLDGANAGVTLPPLFNTSGEEEPTVLPFEDVKNPTVQLVIDDWNMHGTDTIVVQAHTTSITVKSQMKRKDYNEIVEAELVIEPVNLKTDIIIDKVGEKIKLSGGDLSIVGEVVKRAGRELDVDIMAIMGQRLADIQAEARKKATRIKEGGYPPKKTVPEPESNEVEL